MWARRELGFSPARDAAIRGFRETNDLALR
jgi:hypothetical protein